MIIQGRVADLGPDAANQNVNKAVFMEAVVIQMTWPGAPTIYYGDEAGVCGFTDPDNTDGTIRSKQQLSEQMRDYYEKHLDPEKLPSSEDLDILHAAEEARKAFDKNLVIKFRPAIQELEGLGYPGMADPKLGVKVL